MPKLPRVCVWEIHVRQIQIWKSFSLLLLLIHVCCEEQTLVLDVWWERAVQLCLLKALTWHSLQPHLVLIGTDLNNPMEDSRCFNNSTCCGRSKDVSGTLSSTPLLSISWRLQHRNDTSQGLTSWGLVQMGCSPVCGRFQRICCVVPFTGTGHVKSIYLHFIWILRIYEVDWLMPEWNLMVDICGDEFGPSGLHTDRESE